MRETKSDSVLTKEVHGLLRVDIIQPFFALVRSQSFTVQSNDYMGVEVDARLRGQSSKSSLFISLHNRRPPSAIRS